MYIVPHFISLLFLLFFFTRISELKKLDFLRMRIEFKLKYLLVPVISRQTKAIWNMLVEKQELKLKKIRWKFEESRIINFAKLLSSQDFLYTQ